jgi:hypothetical protein
MRRFDACGQHVAAVGRIIFAAVVADNLLQSERWRLGFD